MAMSISGTFARVRTIGGPGQLCPKLSLTHYDPTVAAIVRGLLRQRGYVALALATLTFAVGANVVVFTVVNALWLKPRPVKDPDRVVWVTGDAGSLGSSENFFFAPLGLERLRETGAFESVAGQTSTSGENAALRPLIVFERPYEPSLSSCWAPAAPATSNSATAAARPERVVRLSRPNMMTPPRA